MGRAGNQHGARCIAGMVVMPNQGAFEANQVEQFAGNACILTRDDIGSGQKRMRTRAQIVKVADRRWNDIETGFGRQ